MRCCRGGRVAMCWLYTLLLLSRADLAPKAKLGHDVGSVADHLVPFLVREMPVSVCACSYVYAGCVRTVAIGRFIRAMGLRGTFAPSTLAPVLRRRLIMPSCRVRL